MDIDSFNFSVRWTIEGFRQFLCQHYALSSRRDTPYWKHVTEEITYDNIISDHQSDPYGVRFRVNTFIDLAYQLNQAREFGSGKHGITYIAAGMGYHPMNSTDVLMSDSKLTSEDRFHQGGFMIASIDNWKETKAKYEKHRAKTQSFIDKMPSHYQFLKDNIYAD